MVYQTLVDDWLEWKLVLALVDVCEDNELIDSYQSDVDVEQNGDECKPVQILVMVVNEVTLVPLLHVALVEEAERTLYAIFHDKGNSGQNIAVKGQDLDDKPSVDACQLTINWRIHLIVLRIENSSLVLENRNSVEDFLEHMVAIAIGDQ